MCSCLRDHMCGCVRARVCAWVCTRGAESCESSHELEPVCVCEFPRPRLEVEWLHVPEHVKSACNTGRHTAECALAAAELQGRAAGLSSACFASIRTPPACAGHVRGNCCRMP